MEHASRIKLGMSRCIFLISLVQRPLTERAFGLLFVGSTLGALSFLARQNGILFPLAFLLYTLFWFPAKLKSLHFLDGGFGMPLVAAIGFQSGISTFMGQQRHI